MCQHQWTEMGQHQWREMVQPSKVNGAAVTAVTDRHQHSDSAGVHCLRQLLHRQRQQLVLPAHPTSKEPPRRRQRQATHRHLKQRQHQQNRPHSKRLLTRQKREKRTTGAVAVARERGGPLVAGTIKKLAGLTRDPATLTSRAPCQVRCRKVLLFVELRRAALLLTQT